jgi:hypothetical protein
MLLGYNAATLRIPNDRLMSAIIIELNTEQLKTMRCNTFTLMIASPRLGKEPKISMLKLDMIRKGKRGKPTT